MYCLLIPEILEHIRRGWRAELLLWCMQFIIAIFWMHFSTKGQRHNHRLTTNFQGVGRNTLNGASWNQRSLYFSHIHFESNSFISTSFTFFLLAMKCEGNWGRNKIAAEIVYSYGSQKQQKIGHWIFFLEAGLKNTTLHQASVIPNENICSTLFKPSTSLAAT